MSERASGTRSTSLESLLVSREVLVFCGSGGVGKTSTAAAAALAAAVHVGGRVLVLTIDPAKRLADALGIDGIGNVERRVPDEVLRAAGLAPRGELWAAMLDTKASWDDLVLRHAPDEETAYRILDNRLYDNLTSRFVQSHDYIAMERLYDLHSSGHLRPDRRRHPADPQRDRLPRRTAADGRLLRWAPAAVAHRAVPPRRQARGPTRQLRAEALLPSGRPHPRHAVPPGHRRVLPQLRDDVRGLRHPGPGRRAAPARSADDVRGRHHAGGCAAARGGVLLRRAHGTRLPPRCAGAQQGAARVVRRPGGHGRGRPAGRGRRRRSRRGSAASASTRSPTRRPSPGCCARWARRSRTSPSSRPAKRSCARSSAASPTSLATVPSFADDVHDVAGLARIGECLLRGRSYHRRVSVPMLELARLKTGLDDPALRAPPPPRGVVAGARRPLASPTCCSSRRSTARAAAGSSCSPRCGPPPARPLYPEDLVGRVVEEADRPLVARAWHLGEITVGDAPVLGAAERARLAVHPGAPRGTDRRGREPRGARRRRVAPRRARAPLRRRVRPASPRMIAEGSFPFERRRGRARGGPARRRRRDRARRGPPGALRQPQRRERAAPDGHPRVHHRAPARERWGSTRTRSTRCTARGSR